MSRRNASGDPSFWQLARDFLRDWCPKVRRMSPSTVEAYRIGMEGFISYLGAECGIGREFVTLSCFERHTIKGYMRWMSEVKRYAVKTVDLRMTVLKSFLRYAACEDMALMALYEQAASIKLPKKPKQPIEYLGEDATRAILAANNGGTAKSRRNRMLLILMYDSAARVSELADARVGDLHLARPHFISLTGKGMKTRNMPLMDKTVEHLLVYLDEFHPNRERASVEVPLFYSIRDGSPHALSVDSISQILKAAGDTARASCPDIPSNLHCHLVRKTRAMDLYKEGVPLPLIMQMLGHSSMSTTATFYAFATMKMMTEAIEAANPEAVGEPARWKDDAMLRALYSL